MGIKQDEEKLLEALVNTYRYNLQFFESYDKELFERIASLSSLIDDGLYKERYFLEYIKKNGDFDILDKQNNTYIYDEKPVQYNNKAIKIITNDTKNTFDTMSPDVYEPNNLVDLSEAKFDMYGVRNAQLRIDIRNITLALKTPAQYKEKTFKTTNKMIFVGTLLARHIPRLIKKTNAKIFFVCEANLEIFRLSLFVCDYSLLARDGKRAAFSIMEDDYDFLTKFTLFYNQDLNHNTVFKYYATNYNMQNYFDLIQGSINTHNPLSYDYLLMLYDSFDKLSKNVPKYKTLDFNNYKEISKIFEQKPVIFLGAGPSLSENIKWLKENKEDFIIVAMGATLKLLNQHNIKPDIIVTYDGQPLVKWHFASNDIVNDTIVLVSANTHDTVFDVLKEKNCQIYLFEVFDSLQINGINIGGISIGEATFHILFLFHFRNLYLLGLDLAVNQKTGASHIDTHSSSHNKYDVSQELQDNTNILKEKASTDKDLINTKGNLKKTVITTRQFYSSLVAYNHTAKVLKTHEQNIYNLCEHGAFINDTIPTYIKDIKKLKKINKNTLKKQLQNALNSMSIISLNKESLKLFEDEILEIDLIVAHLDDILDKSVKSSDIFSAERDSVNIMINSLSLKRSNVFQKIYSNFVQIMNIYIEYYFNENKIKDEKNKIKDARYVWIKQVKKLLEDYKSMISSLI
jgi:hypothetical protein